MANLITKVYNANIYVNGVNFAGQAEEVTLPDLKAKMTDHKPLSNMGALELPTGLDKMSMKIKWNTVNAAVMAENADFYTAKDIMIRGNIDIWENGSRTGQAPITAFVRGLSKMTPALGFKHQDNVESESEYTVTSYKLDINGVELFDIDIYANVYKVDGVDLLADYRANLGL